MNVWIVGVCDCESNSIICICDTKELAVKKLFEERDRLLVEWKDMIDTGYDVSEIYSTMIKNLSSDDYENWNNYPQDRPYICEMEVLTEPTPREG